MGFGKYLPGGGNSNDYLTESHKIYEFIWLNKIFSQAILFGLGFLLSYGIIQGTKHFLYRSADREKLALINKYTDETFQLKMQHKITPQQFFQYMNYLKAEKKKIEHKYPNPAFMLSWFEYKPFLIYPVTTLLIFGAGYYYWKKKVEKRLDKEVFYQVHQPESPVAKPSKLVDLSFLQKPSTVGLSIPDSKMKALFDKIFKNFQQFVEYLSGGTAGKFEIDNVKRNMKTLIKNAEKEIDRLGVDKHEFYYYSLLLLTHYEATNYGNLPTGLISVTMKDYTLKKMLSLYYRREIPVLFDVNNEFIERDYLAYVYLKLFYEFADLKSAEQHATSTQESYTENEAPGPEPKLKKKSSGKKQQSGSQKSAPTSGKSKSKNPKFQLQ